MQTEQTVGPTGKESPYEFKLCDDHQSAEQVLERLNAIGYGPDSVSLILDERNLPRDLRSAVSREAGTAGLAQSVEEGHAIRGGLIGAIITGAVVASLAVATGIGTVVGPLVVVLTGLSTATIWGSIVGLLDLGLEADEWQKGLRKGKVAVVVGLKSGADRAAVRNALSK